MADEFSIHGGTGTIQSWDGGRLNTKAHGPGTLVDEYGYTYQCTLNEGVVSGYCWFTAANGNKLAQVYNTQGILHGTVVVFGTDGDIILGVSNDGEEEGDQVEGMMCKQYFQCDNVLAVFLQKNEYYAQIA